jgi:hypothetical protein
MLKENESDNDTGSSLVDSNTFLYVSIGLAAGGCVVMVVGIVLMVAVSLSVRKKRGNYLNPHKLTAYE